MPETEQYRFDFALSFAGTDRATAKQLRDALIEKNLRVFYDRDFEREMFGRDGSIYLRNVYSRESRYCIVLISKEYDQREWTNLERESIQARELRGERGVLIPVLTGKYRPQWLPETRIYFDLATRGVPELIEVLGQEPAIEASGDDALVTAEHLALIHTSWRSPQHDGQFNGYHQYNVHRFDVVLAAKNTEIMDRIEQVTYYLPPAWPPTSSPTTVMNKESRFKLKELAWADVLVRAKVFVRNQKPPVDLSCFVRLTETGPRI